MRFSSLSSLAALLIGLVAAIPSPGVSPDLVSGLSPNKRAVSFNALLATRGISVRDDDDVDYIVCSSDDDCAGTCKEFNENYTASCNSEDYDPPACFCKMESDDACQRACRDDGHKDGHQDPVDGCKCSD